MASADGDDGDPRVDRQNEGGTEPAGSDPAAAPTPTIAARHVPTQMMPVVPTSGAPVGTNAEPLPMISPTSGAPIIRAVARRPPTPLPALGGSDGPRDVPHSARVTVDRRRQAAAEGRATPTAQGRATPVVANPVDATGPNPGLSIPRPRVPGNAPPPSDTPAGPAPATGAGPSGAPADPPQKLGRPGGPSPQSGDGWTSFGPPPPKPGLWRLPPPEPVPTPQATAFGRTEASAPAAPDKRARHADPASEDRHELAKGDEEVADGRPLGPPRHARPAPATLAATVPVASTPGAPARTGALLAATSLLPRVVAEADTDGRGLPPVLDADSWDDEPPPPVPTDDYLGRRDPARLPLRIWLVVGLVLLGLGAAVVVPQLLSPAKDRPTATGPVLGQDSDGPPATSGGELIQPASAGGSTPAATTTKPGAPASTTTPATAVPLVPTTTTSTARPAPPGPPPGNPFSLTLSAIDTHSYQTWQRQDGVCGGSVVLVGAWDAPRPPGSPAGTLTFSNITVPATGTYNMVITYAVTIGGNRNATITLNGTGVNSGGSFASACTGSRTLPLNFTKTSGNTIVFANSTSTAPSIMRIVISKP